MPSSREVTEPVVLVNGAQRKDLRVVDVHRSAGGTRLDSATLELSMGDAKVGDRLHDFAMRSKLDSAKIQVLVPIAGGLMQIHVGKAGSVQATLSSDNAALRFVSRLEPYHFGHFNWGQRVREWHPSGDSSASIRVMTIDEPIVFNPLVDGSVVGNRSQFPHPALKHHMFVPPEASRTKNALAWRNEPDTTFYWSLGSALWYLMWSANQPIGLRPTAVQVQNYPRGLDALEELTGQQRLYNMQVPAGYLPQQLDALLEPFPVGWYVMHIGGVPYIEFFPRGGDARGQIALPPRHQPIGRQADLALTTCEGFDLDYRVNDSLVNDLFVQGNFPEVEVTIELVRAWSAGLDDLTIDDLNLESDNYKSNPDYHRVWRDWCLNEDGSYVDLRPEIKAPPELAKFFKNVAQRLRGPFNFHQPEDFLSHRRRKLLPTITKRIDGSPAGEIQGVRIEWKLSDSDLAEWEVVADEQVQILDREAGIRFAGLTPPPQLMQAGADAKVRATFTLRADTRLTFRAMELARGSVNPENVEMLIDASDRFHYREVHKTSSFGIDLPRDPQLRPEANAWKKTQDVVDDTRALKLFAARLAAAWNQADCQAKIPLLGLDFTYQIGRRVTSIAGRQIDLQTHHRERRHPQITALDWHVAGQQMVLTLDTFRPGAESIFE